MEMYSFVFSNITTVSYTTNPFMKSGPYYMLLFWPAAPGPETALCPVVVFCFGRLLPCGSWMSRASLAPVASGLPINMFVLRTFLHSGQRTWAIVSPLPRAPWKNAVVDASPQSLSSRDSIYATGFGRPYVQPVAFGSGYIRHLVPLPRGPAMVCIVLWPLSPSA